MPTCTLSRFSHVRLCVTPWTSAHQAPLSMARILEWIAIPFPLPGNLPDLAIKPGSPALKVDSLPSEPPGKSCLQANWL